MRRSIRASWVALATGLMLAASPGSATPVKVKGSPPLRLDVPAGFVSSQTDRGVEIKTPDDEVMVWFETYAPEDRDALIKEHNDYWAEQGVTLGDDEHSTDDSGGRKIVATKYKAATWNGKPTVVRYLFIDGGFKSKELVLMSLWASPEGFAAHDADLSKLVNSLDVKEEGGQRSVPKKSGAYSLAAP